MTPRRPIGVQRGKGALTGSPPSFLLVTWESFMTPSPMATHFCIAIRIRVKLEEERGSLNSREKST
jgi:hypothetical protein